MTKCDRCKSFYAGPVCLCGGWAEQRSAELLPPLPIPPVPGRARLLRPDGVCHGIMSAVEVQRSLEDLVKKKHRDSPIWTCAARGCGAQVHEDEADAHGWRTIESMSAVDGGDWHCCSPPHENAVYYGLRRIHDANHSRRTGRYAN